MENHHSYEVNHDELSNHQRAMTSLWQKSPFFNAARCDVNVGLVSPHEDYCVISCYYC